MSNAVIPVDAAYDSPSFGLAVYTLDNGNSNQYKTVTYSTSTCLVPGSAWSTCQVASLEKGVEYRVMVRDAAFSSSCN